MVAGATRSPFLQGAREVAPLDEPVVAKDPNGQAQSANVARDGVVV